MEDVAYLALKFSLDPDSVLDWRRSKRQLWSDVVTRLESKSESVDRVSLARAIAVAVLEPDKLEEFLPEELRNEIQQTGKNEYTDEDVKKIVEKADRIRRKRGSGSYYENSEVGSN